MNYPILRNVLRLYRAKKVTLRADQPWDFFLFFSGWDRQPETEKGIRKTVKQRDSGPDATARFEKLASGQGEGKKTNQTWNG